MYFNDRSVEILNELDQSNGEHGLGRLIMPDVRDFPMATLLDEHGLLEAPSPRQERYWNDMGWWGNQLRTNACTGYMAAHWFEDGPVTHDDVPAPQFDGQEIYKWANANDQWAPTPHEGSSVRAAFKFLQNKGYVKDYYSTQSVDELIEGVLEIGPAGIGTVWQNKMFRPNAQGIIPVTRDYVDVAGGHAYIINGYSRVTKLFRKKGSWGRTWGRLGRGYIHKDDMAFLLSWAGEAMIARENKKPVL